MRYSKEHKAQTHRRIIEEAAARFRREGVAATGLKPLMQALGLTHGGFYAHFKSKDELVAAALQAAAEDVGEACREIFAGDDPLACFVRTYLSDAHCSNPADGCPLPTMSAELGQHGQASEVTDAIVRERLSMIEAALPGPDAGDRSVLFLSALVGALTLSRSLADPALSERILVTARRMLIEEAGGARPHSD